MNHPLSTEEAYDLLRQGYIVYALPYEIKMLCNGSLIFRDTCSSSDWQLLEYSTFDLFLKTGYDEFSAHDTITIKGSDQVWDESILHKRIAAMRG